MKKVRITLNQQQLESMKKVILLDQHLVYLFWVAILSLNGKLATHVHRATQVDEYTYNIEFDNEEIL